MSDEAQASRSAGRLAVRATRRPAPLEEMRPEPLWRAKILTLFPAMWPGPLSYSLIGKALELGIWSCEALDIRSFARDKHRSVDDAPAGGGPGMVLRADVTAEAVDAARAQAPHLPIIALSPRGRPVSQARVRELATQGGAVLLCGRFEGIDERVLEARGVEEICVGDAVLTGGDIPAMALIDATVRLLPGVLGKIESTAEESFSAGLLEHPQYTRPVEWEGRTIPEILLSGHHAKVAEWRRAQAEAATQARRPDLWRLHQEAEEDQSNRTGARSRKDGRAKTTGETE